MKLTEEEYERIAALATHPEKVTHVAREALLRAVAPDPIEVILLGEILVVKWLLLNFPLVDKARMIELRDHFHEQRVDVVRKMLAGLL